MELDISQIVAPHKFERKKLGKNVKCFVCNSLIWSGGCACALCDVPVHKTCAVKARKENCPILEKELTDALGATSGLETPPHALKIGIGGKRESKATLTSLPTGIAIHPHPAFSSQNLNPNDPNIQTTPSSPSGNGGLEIFLSDGTSKSIPYSAETNLLTIVNQIREEKEILDGSFIVYDKAGKVISNFDQSLKKVKAAFPLFFTAIETSSKSGKKSRLRLSSKKKTRLGQNQDPKSLTSSPQLSTKHRSKSILGQTKKTGKKGLFKEIPETVEQRHGTMSITLISVSDLANQTSAYKLLYFTLTNLDNNNQRHRSKLLENTATPTWNQTIKFHMPCSFGQWDIKIWAIRKIDANAADVLLGEANFVLKNFRDGDSEMKTLVLRKEDTHKKEKKSKTCTTRFFTN